MSGIRFEWDEAKNRSNLRKHGIDFEQASRVFLDPLHFSLRDRVENGEVRWNSFGVIEGSMVIVVAHTIRELDSEDEGVDVVRIISARETSRKERRFYEDENG